MSYGLATICELCGEPMSEVYFLENILGTMDSVVSCTDKKCDYWECQPDHNTMADYGLNQDGTALTEKEEDDKDERLFPELELLAEVKKLRELLDDYRRFHTWIGEKDYELIAEWDEMESEEE